MSSIKKLPPHVARELLRHVSPAGRKAALPAASSSADPKNGAGSSSSGHAVLIGCLAFTAAAASLPILAYWWIGRLSDREEALTAAQVRRGAFMNSGSRDVGVDRNWDFATGSYKEPAGYAVMVAEEQNRKTNEMKLRGDFLAMDESELQKHEDKLEAFAKGRGGRGSSSS